VGIFTERDVLYKVAAQEVDLDQLLVGTLMTPSPSVCMWTMTSSTP
jgi:hypothetical protein